MELFLKFQYEIGNVIYFEDIPEFIILQPQWLVDVLKCLVSARKFQKRRNLIYSEAWKDLETTGRLCDELLNEIYSGEDLKVDFLTHKDHILMVMEKFDIIVKPNVDSYIAPQDSSQIESSACIHKQTSKEEGNHDSEGNNATTEDKSEETSMKEADTSNLADSSGTSTHYYVPCLIKSKPISNIVQHFNVGSPNCRRTAWMCMDFEFLPPAFFNHILVSYLRRYQVSREPSKQGNKLALYRGMGVFNLDTKECTKLAVCVYQRRILFQIWRWGSLSSFANRRVWSDAEKTVQAIQSRYRMKVSYVVKMKCPTGSHDNPDGMVELTRLQEETEYFCYEHSTSHRSTELIQSWFKDELHTEKLNYVRIAKPIIELVPDAMFKLLTTSGKDLKPIDKLTLTAVYDLFKTQCTHLPTSGKWGCSSFPLVDSIALGDDLERCRLTMKELQVCSGLESKRFGDLSKLLVGIFERLGKLIQDGHLVRKLEDILSGYYEEEMYETCVGFVATEFSENEIETRIKRHYGRLIEEIQVASLLDHMMTKCVITIDDRRHIDHCVKQSDQNRALLDLVVKRGRPVYEAFLDELRNQGNFDLVACLEEESNTLPPVLDMEVDQNDQPFWTIPHHKIRLQKNYVDIITNIKHENIVDHLISEDILTLDDQQCIEAGPSQTQKNRKLMECLLNCDENGFKEFLVALHADATYSDLADRIEKTDVTDLDTTVFAKLKS